MPVKQKIATIIVSLALLSAVLFCSSKIVYSQELYRVNHGETLDINAHDVCQAVHNNSGKDILVPVKTAEEWVEFRTHASSSIPGISLLVCCGENMTFTYKGSSVTYGTVESQGECWMDRNLGASRVATAYNDSQAYGDLFQWGRFADGHQTRTSGTTTSCSSGDNPGHNNFIPNAASPYDWRCSQNDNLWQGVSGDNNPCPSGWRIPTATEWDTERASWSSNNCYGAYASPLKLTVGGIRQYMAAVLMGVGLSGYYWSSTPGSSGFPENARDIRFSAHGANIGAWKRANGYSVRCIRD